MHLRFAPLLVFAHRRIGQPPNLRRARYRSAGGEPAPGPPDASVETVTEQKFAIDHRGPITPQETQGAPPGRCSWLTRFERPRRPASKVSYCIDSSVDQPCCSEDWLPHVRLRRGARPFYPNTPTRNPSGAPLSTIALKRALLVGRTDQRRHFGTAADLAEDRRVARIAAERASSRTHFRDASESHPDRPQRAQRICHTPTDRGTRGRRGRAIYQTTTPSPSRLKLVLSYTVSEFEAPSAGAAAAGATHHGGRFFPALETRSTLSTWDSQRAKTG